MTSSHTPWAKSLARIAFFALALGLILPGGFAFAEDEEAPTEEAELPWVRDVAAAKAQAAREGKDLFINFTGSDWCGWCMRLDEEVFSHADFIDAATKKYVFVFLDFPRAAELKAAVVDVELNQKMQAEFGVRGFPTIILTTADGTPYGRMGYRAGGPEAYMEALDEAHDGGSKVKKLLADEKIEDKECFRDAFEVLCAAELLGYPKYSHLLDAAEKADPDGSLGLKDLAATERQKQLAVNEEKSVNSMLRTEEPDWASICAKLVETKHWVGVGYLNAVFTTAKSLIDLGNGAEAKALLETAKRDPLIEEHPKAKEIFETLMGEAEAAIAGDDDDGMGDGDK